MGGKMLESSNIKLNVIKSLGISLSLTILLLFSQGVFGLGDYLINFCTVFLVSILVSFVIDFWYILWSKKKQEN